MSGDHYFSDNLPSVEKAKHFEFSLPDRTFTVSRLSGTFSQSGLDIGTAVLLDHVPPPPSGTLVDVGCGWGPLALNCGDIDLERNVISVNKSVATGESGRLLDSNSPTKTRESRSVPLAPVLRERIVHSTKGKGKADPLFVGRGGGRLNYGWLRRTVFIPAARRAGLENVSIHTLRHTCASLLIQMGTPVTTVSHILGHASVKMTLDVYSHFYEQDTEVWVNRLSRSLSLADE